MILNTLTTKKWWTYVVTDTLNAQIWSLYNIYMYQNIALCPITMYNYYVSIKNKINKIHIEQ